MMSHPNEFSPSEGWVNSLSRVLLWPTCLYLLYGLLAFFEDPDFLMFVALGAGVGVFIHFVAYLMIGLPLYLLFWRTGAELWTWKRGLLTGSGLGAFVLLAISLMGGGLPTSLGELMGGCFLGGGYGLITAGAAIVSRRELERGNSR
ncbi:MAG: hypothetical protein ACJAVK_001636 [Akkermansiaceae bacterium]|jgi:hypothetical protein